MSKPNTIPRPTGPQSLKALQAMLHENSVLAAFRAFHEQLGDVFRLQLPGFDPIVLVGAEANEFVLLTERARLRWRSESDPIARLLGHGLLVEDGETLHDRPRQVMSPALHQTAIRQYLAAMQRGTDHVLERWEDGTTIDVVEAMREMSMLIVFESFFSDDLRASLDSLWNATIRLMGFISPGLWMIWANAPAAGYEEARRQLDAYLYDIIRCRRSLDQQPDDLLGLLIRAGYDDDLIRDEMMTMVVAGHDTTTALLGWVWVLLCQHPTVMQAAADEARSVLGAYDPSVQITMEQLNAMTLTDAIVKETLRLYPPAHLGSRIALENLHFRDYSIPAGSRVIYSIYLTHRSPAYWDHPDQFMPERWYGSRPQRFTYLPFGGGPRICIGAQFGETQAKLVVARVLQRFSLALTGGRIHMHMGATIEPRQGRSGARVQVSRCA
jgi:cytochrome P450